TKISNLKFIIISIIGFVPGLLILTYFGSQLTSDMIDFVRGCPRIEGVDEITLPGDPERRVSGNLNLTFPGFSLNQYQ
ncbi:MAG: hypothetical protein IH977_10970, partial [Nitrospinae bacterium]|nr:hypothetical protein [Nitrospinota bacterium]